MNEAIEPLNPIAFQLGPLAVHWYGIIIGLGRFAWALDCDEGK